MKFIIESSLVPIYNRIAIAFAQTMIDFGHEVLFINTHDFTEETFIDTINNLEHDYYISTNELNYIQKKSANQDYFIFEKIYGKIIFIHHDNLFSSSLNLNLVQSKIKSYINIKNKSHHFCIESSNIDILKSFGIENSYKINHFSEFKNNNNFHEKKYNISFVGHLMSSLNLYPIDSLYSGSHLISYAWNRLNHSTYLIQPEIKNLVKDHYFSKELEIDSDINTRATEQFLIAELNKLSAPMRGQLISMIKDHQVEIFGGDLSYGKISDPLLVIDQHNIKYQLATQDYQEASNIYKSSQINLNISSLQFDSAINNRIVDIIMSGGFLLTDRRPDLLEISSTFELISFDTPEEMIEKINFWMNPANKIQYIEIKNEIYDICCKRFSYINSVESIFSKVI